MPTVDAHELTRAELTALPSKALVRLADLEFRGEPIGRVVCSRGDNVLGACQVPDTHVHVVWAAEDGTRYCDVVRRGQWPVLADPATRELVEAVVLTEYARQNVRGARGGAVDVFQRGRATAPYYLDEERFPSSQPLPPQYRAWLATHGYAGRDARALIAELRQVRPHCFVVVDWRRRWERLYRLEHLRVA